MSVEDPMGPEVLTDDEALDLEGPIVLDLTKVDDKPVPEAWHPVKIERAEGRRSRKKNIPQVFFLSRVTDEESPVSNRTIIWNCQLEGDGLLFTKRCFKALGMPEVLEYDSIAALCEDLVGREVEVKVKHQMYQGEKQAKVNNWRPITLDIAF